TGIDEHLAMVQKSETHFFLSDRAGSIVGIADSSGALVNEYTYDAFGRFVRSVEGVSNSIAYAGRESDRETGLYYFRSRYYEPELGRFTTSDLAPGRRFFPQTLNPYSYAINNPLRFVDPFGRQEVELTSPELK